MTKTTKTAEKGNKLAIIRTGNKQYFVKEGDTIKIEKLSSDAISKDKEIEFSDVLLLVDGENVQVGNPTVKSKVTAELIEEGRDKKITVIHYRAKSRYFKKNGHRQPFMKVKISKIA